MLFCMQEIRSRTGKEEVVFSIDNKISGIIMFNNFLGQWLLFDGYEVMRTSSDREELVLYALEVMFPMVFMELNQSAIIEIYDLDKLLDLYPDFKLTQSVDHNNRPSQIHPE